jgi:hypothetical protein
MGKRARQVSELTRSTFARLPTRFGLPSSPPRGQIALIENDDQHGARDFAHPAAAALYDVRRPSAKLAGRAGRLLSTSALDASLSQRSCNILQLAVTSGELAILARRAQSAAWSRQYLAYDADIARSLTHPYLHALPPMTRRQAETIICGKPAEHKA